MIAELDAAHSSLKAMYELALAGMESERRFALMAARDDLNSKLLAIQQAHLVALGRPRPPEADAGVDGKG